MKKKKKRDDILEKKPVEKNTITLLQLSGFPYFDMDLSYLFCYFNFESFFTLYLFSFLEFKMIFFSPHLDFINTLMYIMRFLSYPFIDNNDLGQIYSITKEEFLSGKEIKNNLIGVNCAYGEKITIPNFYKDYFIISYNLNTIIIYFNNEVIFSYDINKNKKKSTKSINVFTKNIELNNINNSNVLKLIKYIENALKEDVVMTYFLEKNIGIMYGSLFQCFRIKLNKDKINSNNNNNNDNSNNSEITLEPIKELKYENNDFKNYDYEYDEYREYNESILKAFYTFNISIYEYFHDMIKLIVINNPKINCKDTYESVFYAFKNEKNKNKDFCECDYIFMDYFEKTSKYHQFIDLFLQNNLCSELNRLPMIMTEEFININKIEDNELVKDYMTIINDFYQNTNMIAKIDFVNFYIYYKDNLAKTIFHAASHTKTMKPIYEENKNIKTVRYYYKPKEYLLDNKILQKYVFLLNNMDEEQLRSIFPTINFNLNDNVLHNINTTNFADFLEQKYFVGKKDLNEEIIVLIVLIIYIITLKRNKIIFHFFEEILKMGIKEKIILRKYIFVILLLLNEMTKKKLNKNENIIRQLLLYKEIMNCIYKNDQSNEDLLFYPNERLSTIIYNFNNYQRKYEEMIKSNKTIENESQEIISKYYSNESDMLNVGTQYMVVITKNSCRDKGAMKNEELIKLADSKTSIGSVQKTCETCNYKIEPLLVFVHEPSQNSAQFPFYTLYQSYLNLRKNFQTLMKNDSSENKQADKDFYTTIGNIIFYLNLKKGEVTNISNYLASCV